MTTDRYWAQSFNNFVSRFWLLIVVAVILLMSALTSELLDAVAGKIGRYLP